MPDHDQRHIAGVGVTWQHATGLTISTTTRYEWDTPVPIQGDDDLEALIASPGGEMVDVGRGRVKGRSLVSLQAQTPVLRHRRFVATVVAQVLNVFDARYAYNLGNPFSGTHFGAPRTIAMALRVTFGRSSD